MTVLTATRGAPATSEIRNNLALKMAGTSIREDLETILTKIDNGLADVLAQHTVIFHSDNEFTYDGTQLVYDTTGLEIKVIHNSTGSIFTYTIPVGETLNFSADERVLYAIIARDGSGTGDTPSNSLTIANNNLVADASFIPSLEESNIWYIPIAIRIDGAESSALHWFFGHGSWTSDTTALVGISGGAGGLDKWETGKTYSEDDVIWNSDDNKIYTCTATGDGHTSGTFATDLASNYWQELSEQSVYTDPLSARGDIFYRNTLNISEGLAVGADGTVLTSDGTDPSYNKITDSNIDNAAAIQETKLDLDYNTADLNARTENKSEELVDLLYQAKIKDDFTLTPETTMPVDISSGKTDSLLHDSSNQYYRLNYDASKTVTGSGTSMTISTAPSYTVKAGDILIIGDEAKGITAVASQTSYTIESAFDTDPSSSACCISQAVHTTDLNNFDYGGEINSAASQFSDDIYESLITYEDSETDGDVVPDWGTTAHVAFSASNDETTWTNKSVRNKDISDSLSSIGFSSGSSSLYARFFANKSSGTGQVNLLNFKIFWHRDYGQLSGESYFTAFCRPSSSIEVNCSHAVVSGKSRLTFTESYGRGLNPTEPAGSALDVFINGQKIPRYIDGTNVDTSGAYFKEITDSIIELDQDYSGTGVDIQVTAPRLIVDTRTQNTSRIASLEDTNYGQAIDAITKDFVTTQSKSTTAYLDNGELDGGDYWKAAGNLNTARSSLADSGTQNAALSFGGYTTSYSAVTEKFNGSTWTTSGNLNTARRSLAGSGTQNAALSFGGTTDAVSAVTEKFNGSTWTASGNLNTARRHLAGSGTQNAALSFGGYTGSNSAVTEKFNGSTWTASGNLNTARYALAGSGTQNAALSFGGTTGSNLAVTEKFNGSTWTASGNLNTARRYLAGSGTQNAALSFGGYTTATSAVTEKFNGSTWTASGNLNTARYALAGSGTQNAALSFGGYTGAVSAVTEKFNGTVKTTGKFTHFNNDTKEEIDSLVSQVLNKGSLVSAEYDVKPYYDEDEELTDLTTLGKEGNDNYWKAAGNLNTARSYLAGSGTQNAALSFGGYTGANSAVTEKFNGSTWTASGNLNTARNDLAGSGTQNAALSFGGTTGATSAVTEKFNGSTWTASGNLNTARYALAGSGTQNAALSFGGTTGSNLAVTEKFNGSTWTASGNLNTARRYLAGSGTQNAALSFGGTTGAYSAVTEKFNGSTWTTSGNLNTARSALAGSGTQNAALSFGGYTGSNLAVTEKFNGSTWTASGNLNTARRYLAGSGTQNAALSFGGTTGSYSAVTEKFNGSTWTASGNLNTARSYLAGSGTQNAALSFGGITGAVLAVTEKRIATQEPSAYNFSLSLLTSNPVAAI